MKRLILVTILALVLPSTALAQQILIEKCELEACPNCNCYWSTDCASGEFCNYSSGCTKVGKLDGTCKKSATPIEVESTATAATSLGLWLEAFEQSTADEGLPAMDRFNRIRSAALSSDDRRRVQEAAFNAMDILVGFDLNHPRGDCEEFDARCLGIVRLPVEPRGIELLRTARAAMVRTIQTGDRTHLEHTLTNYWKRNPLYRPHHTGRCYPHGHREYPFRSIAQCQIEELNRIVDDLVGTGG
jgi:hypothetical protein